MATMASRRTSRADSRESKKPKVAPDGKTCAHVECKFRPSGFVSSQIPIADDSWQGHTEAQQPGREEQLDAKPVCLRSWRPTLIRCSTPAARFADKTRPIEARSHVIGSEVPRRRIDSITPANSRFHSMLRTKRRGLTSTSNLERREILEVVK
ncbi:hypothetical protein Mp_2g16880 [Marchantia polymorpha subsp. ruderalis]|uniref:Uncharacterized protein n=1 Tax=Marchantia polymorpha TaxID=3197 RepID=A0A2R6WCM2_MARPO|nr:hypothetical protein MARPO_0109s0029 [Marchantia polymorpha]BBN02640.1 hypothetical protein Mp_2g16880 [Marchantia polymorpha subsp. ruderalis]|eukprot:PTQ31598.1 hypothetical protein MARPO_0109s0029 [Marchantia polymorpha]